MKQTLFIIDAQNYFINGYAKDIPLKIADYIRKRNFEYVLFFRFVNSRNSNFFKDLRWNEMFTSPDIDIVPELQEFVTKKNLFSKTSFSALESQEVRSFLEVNKIKRLLICGFDTDGCVLATATEAFDKGYKVRVLQDLCASHHGSEFHRNAIEIIKRNMRSVVMNSLDV